MGDRGRAVVPWGGRTSPPGNGPEHAPGRQRPIALARSPYQGNHGACWNCGAPILARVLLANLAPVRYPAGVTAGRAAAAAAAAASAATCDAEGAAHGTLPMRCGTSSAAHACRYEERPCGKWCREWCTRGRHPLQLPSTRWSRARAGARAWHEEGLSSRAHHGASTGARYPPCSVADTATRVGLAITTAAARWRSGAAAAAARRRSSELTPRIVGWFHIDTISDTQCI